MEPVRTGMPHPDLLMHRFVLQATITVVTLRAGFGPVHFKSMEPVLAKLHQAIVDRGEGCSYIPVSPEFLAEIEEAIRYSSQHWQWLRDIYRRAKEDKDNERQDCAFEVRTGEAGTAGDAKPLPGLQS